MRLHLYIICLIVYVCIICQLIVHCVYTYCVSIKHIMKFPWFNIYAIKFQNRHFIGILFVFVYMYVQYNKHMGVGVEVGGYLSWCWLAGLFVYAVASRTVVTGQIQSKLQSIWESTCAFFVFVFVLYVLRHHFVCQLCSCPTPCDWWCVLNTFPNVVALTVMLCIIVFWCSSFSFFFCSCLFRFFIALKDNGKNWKWHIEKKNVVLMLRKVKKCLSVF